MLFVFTVYLEQMELINHTFGSVERHYPDAQIMLFFDNAERLKLPKFAGRWTERYFKSFLETDETLLVKIDPDTVVNRRADFPDAPLFGTRRWQNMLSGAAVGYSRQTVQQIIDSKMLLDEKYTSHWYQYQRFQAPHLRPGETPENTWVSLQDDIITDIASRLNIPITDWPDVSLTDPTAPFYHKP
jgi:hypothetical protein